MLDSREREREGFKGGDLEFGVEVRRCFELRIGASGVGGREFNRSHSWCFQLSLALREALKQKRKACPELV